MQIGDYEMDYTILDLCSDINILTQQTWDNMGNPCLDWSPIQLRLPNQAKVLPIGRLRQVPIDIEGLCTFVDLEVINIVDDTNPYPKLLGIYWAINNHTIINFKKMILSFKDNEMRVVSPIDPLEGQRYIDPIYNEGQGDYLDQIYNVTALQEDYINPTTDGKLSWKSVSCCTSDSGEALENWKNRLHEVSMRQCARITHSVRWVEN